MIKFSHIIFYVSDVKETAAFFEEAFRFKVKFMHESKEYAELDTGEVSISFASEKLGASNLPDGFQKQDLKSPPFACEIALTTDDVQRDFNHAVDLGATEVAQPAEKPWGQVVGYIRDPNGILIEIGSQLG